MAWECAECVRKEMNGVCHHCGKLLCEEHTVILVDDALAENDAAVSAKKRMLPDHAVHCSDCHKQHHPKALVVKSSVEQVTT
jgi:hypothetical protein